MSITPLLGRAILDARRRTFDDGPRRRMPPGGPAVVLDRGQEADSPDGRT